MVDVHAGHGHLNPRLAAVGAPVDVGLQRPDRLGIVPVDENFVVVTGVTAAVPVVGRPTAPSACRPASSTSGPTPARQLSLADPGPARPCIVRAEKPSLAALSRHERVD